MFSTLSTIERKSFPHFPQCHCGKPYYDDSMEIDHTTQKLVLLLMFKSAGQTPVFDVSAGQTLMVQLPCKQGKSRKGIT
jgi:hypothetical protein